MGGGAWSFLVGGVICLLNCDNERDLSLLNSKGSDRIWGEGGEVSGGTCKCIPHLLPIGSLHPLSFSNSLLLRGTIGVKPMEA